MFEKSKSIAKKINNSGCVTLQEMQIVEMGLRLYEVYSEMLNESLGLAEKASEQVPNFFELEYQIEKNARTGKIGKNNIEQHKYYCTD